MRDKTSTFWISQGFYVDFLRIGIDKGTYSIVGPMYFLLFNDPLWNDVVPDYLIPKMLKMATEYLSSTTESFLQFETIWTSR